MKFLVIGSGAWGCALSNVISDNNHECLIYGKDINEVNEIKNYHTNKKYLDNIKLNINIKASDSLEYSLKEYNPEIILIATPSSALVSICESIKKYSNNNPLIINVSKGLDKNTFKPLSETIRDTLKDFKYQEVVTLIGPTFALEVANKELTLICAVCRNIEYAKKIQTLLSTNYFRIYSNDDEIGAEYGACIKNVIAICSGIANGLGYKENARAALITRGLHEMTLFGLKMGAKKETYLGLTGIGDLFLTCSSFKSRNYSLGYEIGKNNNAEIVLKNNSKTVEGAIACKYLYEASKKLNIEMPLTTSCYNVLYNNKKPSEEVLTLMERELKKE